MKSKKYHTVVTVSNSNRKNRRKRKKNDTRSYFVPLTHKYRKCRGQASFVGHISEMMSENVKN